MSRDDAAFTQDAPERSRDEPQASVWRLRIQDWQRHVRDLQTRTYEGAAAREKREEVYRKAFDLVTPIAEQVLADINSLYLEGTGELQLQTPVSDGAGGLIGWWSLTWPLLRKARNRFTGEPLEPVAVTAIFPLTPTGAMQWTHPHLAFSGYFQRRCRAPGADLTRIGRGGVSRTHLPRRPELAHPALR